MIGRYASGRASLRRYVEFLSNVAIVHVEGSGSGEEASNHTLEILGGVIQILSHERLTALMTLECVALNRAAKPMITKVSTRAIAPYRRVPRR